MRNGYVVPILASASLAVLAFGPVVVAHYMAPTFYELNHEAMEVNTSVNSLWLESMARTSEIESHSSLFKTTMKMIVSFERLQQAQEDLATQTYGVMAVRDPVRFQFRRAECWIRNEDSIRCRAVNKVARA